MSRADANNPELSVLVISYNTRELTLDALRTLIDQTRCDYEVIVWDNASSDGSADAIEAEFGGRVRLTRSEENLGFAGANNAAAEHASGRYLLLLNPDTEVLDGAVDKLLAFADSNPEAGIWGGRTVFADGRVNPSSCWTRMTVWSLVCQVSGLSKAFSGSRVFNPEAVSAWWSEGEREVDIVSGCFFLIKRDLWDRLGGFDPAFFMYGEEADLCLRAKKLGVRPMVTADAVIVHHGGASEKIESGKISRILNAKMQLVERHMSKAGRGVARALLLLWPMSRSLLSWSPFRRHRRRSEVWIKVWRDRSYWAKCHNKVAGEPS
ncbi:MAG: glycosyltransferase family 2 protein [Phycisphaerales bacterium]|nr:glycosyltransferase family 2 protein [Phycisphaerales bacterium]